MSVSGSLVVLAGACVVWAVVSLVLLTAALDRRGTKTAFPFIGVLSFRNLLRYKEITRAETGRVGGLFWSYVVPINAALLLVVVVVMIRAF